MKRLAAFAILLGATAAGCGYHAGGHADMMPPSVHTIAIPPFSNSTAVGYKLVRLLPEDITREFLSRTRYVVVTDASQADAVLEGGLANYNALPTVSDPVSGRATMDQVVVTLNLKLTDRRTAKVLFERKGAEFWQRYEVALDPKQYFDESGTAMDRVSRSVASSVVSAILEGF